MISFFKTHYIVSTLGTLIILGGGSALIFRADSAPDYDTVVVVRADVVEEVNVTGRVKPAQDVSLAFEKGGKVMSATADVGDHVEEGDVLVSLEKSELSSQLLQAEANLETEQARLAELNRGSRPEEIQSAVTKVENAKRALADAESKLANTQNKVIADLNDDYTTAVSKAQKAVDVAKSALVSMTAVQYAHFMSFDFEDTNIAQTKQTAVEVLLGAVNAGRWSVNSLSTLGGGVYGSTLQVVRGGDPSEIETKLSGILDALQSVKKALDTLPLNSELSSAETTSITTERTNLNTEITAISNAKQAIALQKLTNDSALTVSMAELTTAQNVLSSAEDDLILKKAGTIVEQVNAQEARVKSARANKENIEAQINKTMVKAPFAGVVTQQDAKEGEIVSAGVIIISLISEAKFEVEARIPEADISQIKVGDTAMVTLDAYGKEEVFFARVSSVDPAETLVDGVATYKTTLQFVDDDPRIKSGMTANVDIETARRENVLAVPQRAVIRTNGERFVEVVGLDGLRRKVHVQTGIRGRDGNIEILSGDLKVDDLVVI